MIKHSPVDVMHFIMNLVKDVLGYQYDTQVRNKLIYIEKLQRFPWTTAQKERRRIPTKPMVSAKWKADECQIFSYPCAENVLDELLGEEHYDITSLLARLIEMLYGPMGRGPTCWDDAACNVRE